MSRIKSLGVALAVVVGGLALAGCTPDGPRYGYGYGYGPVYGGTTYNYGYSRPYYGRSYYGGGYGGYGRHHYHRGY